MPHARIAHSTRRHVAIHIPLVILFCFAGSAAFAQTETVLYNFQPTNDVLQPFSSLAADTAGNLYGVAISGGSGCTAANCGGVFRLSPPSAPGGAWTETVLYNFGSNPNDGVAPRGGLVFDKQGNLYGTTTGGGTGGYGTVFELSPPSTPTGSWTESILHNYKLGTNDGNSPVSGLVFDANGNLYGTTTSGGAGYCDGYPGGCGTAFELSPPAKKGGAWRRTIIHGFGSGTDGSYPWAPLIVGAGGILYGTTAGGGLFNCSLDGMDDGCGVVFQLTPPSTTGGRWTESYYLLPSSQVGIFFFGALVQGRNGALYAPTYAGGSGQQNCQDQLGFPIGCGGILELVPPAPGNTKWHVSTIYSFTGLGDGALPFASLTADSSGNLYGTTGAGGGLGNCRGAYITYAAGCGTVFKLSPPTSVGGSWTETTLHDFSGGSDGQEPWASLLLNHGVLYGSTPWGGYNNGFSGLGTIYSVVP
jgi:uncharacterized repeat protein (TIGR03803 family)